MTPKGCGDQDYDPNYWAGVFESDYDSGTGCTILAVADPPAGAACAVGIMIGTLMCENDCSSRYPGC